MSTADGMLGNYISTLEHRFADVPDEQIPVIAASLHDRLARDPSWSGSVPSAEQIESDYRRVQRSSSVGRPPWLDELQERLAAGTDIALRGSAIGRPHFRLLSWSDRINTTVHPVEGSELDYLVLIHEAMPSYVELVVRSVLAILPDGYGTRAFDDDELWQAIDERMTTDSERGPMQFAEATVYMAADGHTGRVGRRIPEHARVSAATQMHRNALLFMVAHEVAHFELGHYGAGTPALRTLGAAHASTNFDREIQADELGLSQSSHALNARDGALLETASLGAWFFLSAYQALESALCVLVAGSADEGRRRFDAMQERKNPDRHPSPFYRKVTLYNTVQRAVGDSEVLRGMWRGADLALLRLMHYASAYAESGIGHGLTASRTHWGHERDLAYRS